MGGLKDAAEKFAVAIESVPQRLEPDLDLLFMYGLKAVPFKNLSSSAAIKSGENPGGATCQRMRVGLILGNMTFVLAKSPRCCCPPIDAGGSGG
jgi:hypothetical protein